MADHPLEELGGKTPLQAADVPNMDWIAREGRSGLLRTVPEGMKASSDVAIMSILGYDPRKFHTGRGPLEAAGLGVELEDNEFAFRCNFVTVEDGIMNDYSAGHITTEESEELMKSIREEFRRLGDFYTGTGFRHLFVPNSRISGLEEIRTTPPHEIVGKKVENNIIEPRNNSTAEILNKMISDSKGILSDHPINFERENEGKKPANSIWIWGQGRKPRLEPKYEGYGISGAIASDVPLIRGLGIMAGLNEVNSIQGIEYSNAGRKERVDIALAALKDYDLLIVHEEAPDEAGHAGDVEKKIESIEDLDRLIGGMRKGLEGKDFAISVMPDHPTPVKMKNHVSEPVPFSIYSTQGDKDEVTQFNEYSARDGAMKILKGRDFLTEFLGI